MSVEIPLLIYAACAVLVVLFFLFLSRMLREAGELVRHCRQFAEALGQLLPVTPVNRRQGMPLEQLERLRSAVAAWPPRLRAWWAGLEGALEPYAPPDQPQGWFATEPVEKLLSQETVLDRHYHASFHQVVPGLLTGLGLMATFIAILIALAGVTVSLKGNAETVTGIGALINGLAGKFLSSIVALFLSVVFTLVEKKWCERRLLNAYAGLLAAAREAVPVLSPARVLLDLQILSARRTALLQNVYAELVDRLLWAFKTELSPLLSETFAQEVGRNVQRQIEPLLEAASQVLRNPDGRQPYALQDEVTAGPAAGQVGA